MAYTQNHQRIFIGGIAGGIGSALAAQLKENGAVVGGFARASERLDHFRESHPDIEVADVEASDAKAVKEAIEQFAKQQEGIDGYVHAVGNVFLKPLHMIRDEEWEQTLACNLTSAFYAARAAVGKMRRQKHGHLVFFSSVAAVSGLANHEAIGAAKGGIIGLARSIAATYAANGIRSNAIAPGLVETPATASLTGNEDARKFSERMHPLGRLGKPEELAALARFLLSEEAGWITGQVFSADGGMGSIVPKPRA